MNVIDTLFLALGVDAKGIDKGLNEARAKIQAGAQGLANSLMAPFKTALGAVAAGLSLGAVTNQYLQQADAIGKMADSIGVDMEELQAWGEAAARAGGSAQAFQQSLQSMNRSLQLAAQGQGEAAKMFQTFGIKVTDATGKARDSFDVLRDLAGAMEGMDKQKAMGFGQRLGLDRGTIMLLQSGKVAVDDLIRRQKELGVYTKEDAEITAKANDAIADLGQSMKAAAAIFMRAIVPAITWVTEHLTALVQDFRKHKTFYLAALGAIAAFLTAKMIPTLVKVGLLNARIWAPYAVVAGIIAGLALIFDDLWTYMNGGKSALEDYWKTLGTGPELLEKFNKAWQAVRERGTKVLNSIKNAAKAVFEFFTRNIDSFLLLFDGVWDMLDGLFNFDFGKVSQGLGKAFQGAWKIIDAVFTDIFKSMDKLAVWEAIKTNAKAAWDSLGPHIIGIIDGIITTLKGLVNFDFGKVGEGLGKAFTGAWQLISNVFNNIFSGMDKMSVWDAIKNGAQRAWDTVKTLAAGFFEGLPKEAQQWITQTWNNLVGTWDWKNLGTKFSQAFFSAASTVSGILDGLFTEASNIDWWSTVTSTAAVVWEGAKGIAQTAWENIKKFALGFFEGLPKEAQEKLVRLWDSITGLFDWESLKKSFTDVFSIDWEKIKKAIIDTFDKAVAAIKKMFSDWIDELIADIKGIINMIPGVDTVKNAAGAVGDAVSGAWGTVKGWFGGNDAAAAATPSPKDAVSAQAAAAANVTETTNNTTNNDSHNTYNITVQNQPNAEQFAHEIESFGRRGPGLGRMAASGQTN